MSERYRGTFAEGLRAHLPPKRCDQLLEHSEQLIVRAMHDIAPHVIAIDHGQGKTANGIVLDTLTGKRVLTAWHNLFIAPHNSEVGYATVLDPRTHAQAQRLTFFKSGPDCGLSVDILNHRPQGLPVLYQGGLSLADVIVVQGVRHLGRNIFEPFSVQCSIIGSTTDDGLPLLMGKIETNNRAFRWGDSGAVAVLVQKANGQEVPTQAFGTLRGMDYFHSLPVALISPFAVE